MCVLMFCYLYIISVLLTVANSSQVPRSQFYHEDSKTRKFLVGPQILLTNLDNFRVRRNHELSRHANLVSAFYSLTNN